MRNLLIAMLLVTLSALGIVAFLQSRTLLVQQTSIDMLSVKVDAYEKAKNLSLQSECAKQAKQEFNNISTGDLDTFTNHYNGRLNKCFVLDDGVNGNADGSVLLHKSLIDAYENKSYGTYLSRTEKGQKIDEQSPAICKVIGESGEEQKCHSEKEFDALIMPYLK